MEIKLPHLGEGADSGNVVSIFVKEGDTIKKEQMILELESEKAVASIPSPNAGKITQIHVKEGDKISVGQIILTLEEALEESTKVSEKKPEEIEKETADEKTSTAQEEETGEISEPSTKSGLKPAASPSIRKLARDLGIDLSKVHGSERGGRIVMQDLKNYIQRLQKKSFDTKEATDKTRKPPTESIDFGKWGSINRQTMSSIRKIISQRMQDSWNVIPHVTQFDEADITDLMELKKKYDEVYAKKDTQLTLTSFALKIVVDTLKKHPLLNASIDEANEEIVFKQYYHIGIAVDTDAGLIVPVIRDVDKKNILELSKDLETISDKARNRKITMDDLKGGSFTISNQGGIGSGHFTPIVNKPEVAILGIGRGKLKPVTRNKKMETRFILPLGLSYDHRLIDGANAARFMIDLVKAFEEFKESELKI